MYFALGAAFKIMDISDVGNPVEQATVTQEGGHQITGIITASDNNKLYTSAWDNKLRVYDISNVQSPLLLDTINIGVYGEMSLTQDGNTLYVYHGSGVTVVDVGQ